MCARPPGLSGDQAHAITAATVAVEADAAAAVLVVSEDVAARLATAGRPVRVLGGARRGGGALARGHPIGASGAILAVRLWHELQQEEAGAAGLAAIAAAGGLGSALLMRR